MGHAPQSVAVLSVILAYIRIACYSRKRASLNFDTVPARGRTCQSAKFFCHVFNIPSDFKTWRVWPDHFSFLPPSPSPRAHAPTWKNGLVHETTVDFHILAVIAKVPSDIAHARRLL